MGWSNQACRQNAPYALPIRLFFFTRYKWLARIIAEVINEATARPGDYPGIADKPAGRKSVEEIPAKVQIQDLLAGIQDYRVAAHTGCRPGPIAGYEQVYIFLT